MATDRPRGNDETRMIPARRHHSSFEFPHAIAGSERMLSTCGAWHGLKTRVTFQLCSLSASIRVYLWRFRHATVVSMNSLIAFGGFLLWLVVLAGMAKGVELGVKTMGSPRFCWGAVSARLCEREQGNSGAVDRRDGHAAWPNDHLRPPRPRAARAGSWAGRTVCQFCHAFCAFSRTCAR